jgi:hypothetical protein
MAKKSRSTTPCSWLSIMDEISLKVRVRWLTKTETIPLDEGWAVSDAHQSECR